MRRAGLWCVLGFAAAFASAEEADVCTEGELRAALETGGEIRFSCDTIIELTNPLKIEQDAVVDGGTNEVTLSGGGEVRVFEVAEGVSFTLKNINVVNGKHRGTDGYRDTTGVVVHATEGYGGALAATNAIILIQSCVFSNNAAIGGDGGGDEHSADFFAEPAGAAGGAIFSDSSQLEILSSHFLTNSAILGDRRGVGPISLIDSLGGAIRSREGILRITDSIFQKNFSMVGGGAVSAQNAAVLVDGCRFDSNITQVRTASRFSPYRQGSGRGGALDISGSPASVTNSVFFANVLGGGGGFGGAGGVLLGGAISSEERITISESTFLNNVIRAQGGNEVRFPVTNCAGGALWVGNEAVISDSRFIANQVYGGDADLGQLSTAGPAGSAFGGAISAGALEVLRGVVISNLVQGGKATMFGEGALSDKAGNSLGGGIFTTNLSLTNVTVAFNRAEVSTSGLAGGAVHVEGGTGTQANTISFSTIATNEISHNDWGWPDPTITFALNHLTVDNNTSVTLSGTILSGGGGDSVEGEITDGGYNISDGDLFTESTSMNNSDALLGPIGFYGGPTETIPVRTGSPAIDGVVTGAYPATDQRGRARPYGGGADIGAYEVSSPFVVQGRVRLHRGEETVTLVASGEALQVDPSSGEFAGFFETPGVLQPILSGFVFYPAEVALTEGVDHFGLDFVGYKYDETAIERSPSDGENVVITFATATEGDYQLQRSEDLSSWTEDEVQHVPADGLFRSTTTAGAGRQFFRIRKL